MRKFVLILYVFPILLLAQSARFDDFSGEHPWWLFHRDGSAAKDPQSLTIENGYLVLKLSNPDAGLECNVGISDPRNLYGKNFDYLSFEARVKALNPMKPGSRGWGFWKAARGGRASSLAWFMQQFDARHAAFSWSRMGVISHRKTAFRDWLLRPGEWHVYGVERDRMAKTTRFFIDGKQVYATPGVVPLERMSFHLWIDNQVYSRKRGIIRQKWTGASSLIVDYVKINTQRLMPPVGGMPEEVVLFNPLRMPFSENARTFHFIAQSDTVYVLSCARAEYNEPYAAPDRLILNWNGQRAFWTGDSLHGKARFVMLKQAIRKKEQAIKFSARETPLLAYTAALGVPGLRLVMDKQAGDLQSAMTFKTQDKKLLLVFALKPIYHAETISADLNGQSLQEAIERQLRSTPLLGIDRLIIVKVPARAGKNRLRLPLRSLALVDRLLVFSCP